MSLLFGGQGIEIDESPVKDSGVLRALRCESVRDVRSRGRRPLLASSFHPGRCRQQPMVQIYALHGTARFDETDHQVTRQR